MIISSRRNAGNYFTGRKEKIHQPDGRDEVIDQKTRGNYVTVSGSLTGEKNQGSALQYQIQPSLAGWVLQSHKDLIVIQTKKNSTTGLYHSYDIEHNFTYRFPINFRGSFICGAIDHFGTSKCPIGIKDKEENKLFFNAIWAHKPYTKRKNQEEIPVSQL